MLAVRQWVLVVVVGMRLHGPPASRDRAEEVESCALRLRFFLRNNISVILIIIDRTTHAPQ